MAVFRGTAEQLERSPQRRIGRSADQALEPDDLTAREVQDRLKVGLEQLIVEDLLQKAGMLGLSAFARPPRMYRIYKLSAWRHAAFHRR